MFRLGDFYEMFGDDAKLSAKILNITLTARNKGTANEIAMCGVPHHAVEGYIAKLTRAGKRVAVCEQMSDPTLPGIVKREVIRVVTPGTTLDDSVLDTRVNNYLLALTLQKNTWGFSLCDLNTGEFMATEIGDFETLRAEIGRVQPSEVIVPSLLFNDSRYQDFLVKLPNINIWQLPNFENAERLLTTHFKLKNLTSFGLAELPVAVEAAGNLFGYLKETQKAALEHISALGRYSLENYMVLDQATMRNLELLQNSWTFSSEGSLLSIIDRTTTSMGARQLRRWLLMPLVNIAQIRERHVAVGEIVNSPALASDLQEILKQIFDFERLLGRIGCGRANARDLVSLKYSLSLMPNVRQILSSVSSALLKKHLTELPDLSDLVKIIEDTLVAEPPFVLNEGGMIRSGFNAKLDELRLISTSGKDFILDLQKREIERTGISSLKIRYNSVFGYYIEISKSNLSAVPADYIRKQTLVNAERFITPELKEYEEKVLGAEEQIKQIEYQIFLELREKITQYFPAVQKTAKLVSELDALLGLAILSRENNYVCPVVDDSGIIEIREGRHPVIERFVDRYVPNDVALDHEAQEITLLTGPNMSGKSSYLRQVAIITLLAQIGSFVPAKSAHIGVVDRIFTRVGASDNLSQGVSTFMNEMQEAANIINNATSKSLIILDEIGRGTATYDGVSIAAAIVEYLHNIIKAKTIFATHYHELVAIIEELPRAENYCVAVSEDNGRVVFLHKIIKGAASDSYGIEVAKLAGLPRTLTDRAEEILRDFEEKKSMPLVAKPEQGALSLTIREERLVGELAKLDPNQLTPLQALEHLSKLKKDIDEH